MSNFYYRIEPFKGYIPADKVRHAGQPFESANSIVSGDIRNRYREIRKEKGAAHAFKEVRLDIEMALASWIKERKAEQLDATKRPFYVNFNADGFDVFISRWNWKDNN